MYLIQSECFSLSVLQLLFHQTVAQTNACRLETNWCLNAVKHSAFESICCSDGQISHLLINILMFMETSFDDSL